MTERLDRYDNYKLLLIFLVVLGHLGNKYAGSGYMMGCMQFWAYLFHMPAFVFVSGLFSKKAIEENRYHIILSYVRLYMLMCFAEFCNNYLLSGEMPGHIFTFTKCTGTEWYCLGMAWWYLATFVLKKAKPALVFPVLMVRCLASGYFSQVSSFLSIQRALLFYPFFYAGYVSDARKISGFAQKKPVRILSAAVIRVSVIVVALKFESITGWRNVFRARYTYMRLAKQGFTLEYGWLYRTVAYLVSALMGLSALSLTPNVRTIFTKRGRQTLPVYFWHQMVIAFMLKAIPGLNKWVKGAMTGPKCILFRAAVTMICLIPVFNIPLRRLFYRKKKPTE